MELVQSSPPMAGFFDRMHNLNYHKIRGDDDSKLSQFQVLKSGIEISETDFKLFESII